MWDKVASFFVYCVNTSILLPSVHFALYYIGLYAVLLLGTFVDIVFEGESVSDIV
jgi:hypothetical protein